MPDLTFSSGFYKVISCACFALINLLLKKIHLPASQIACLESILGAMLLWMIPLRLSYPKNLKQNSSSVAHDPSIKAQPLSANPHFIPDSHDSSSSHSVSLQTIPNSSHCSLCIQDSTAFLSNWSNPLYWIRAVLALSSSWLWVMGIQKMPLLQTVAMGFLSPFVTLIGAWFFLKESITYGRIFAIFLAFLAGVMISFSAQKEFSFNLFDPWVLAPLGTTILFALTNLISKSLLVATSPLILTRSLMLFTGLGLLTTYTQWVPISFMEMGKLFILSVLASSAHICSHLAMAKSDIVALLPLGVIRLVLTGVLGWFFLNETPSFALVCGIVLGIGASFCLSWRLK